MNILFTFVVHWPHHLGTESELLQRHLEDGDSVEVLTCLGDSPGCVTNPLYSKWKCHSCIKRRLTSFCSFDRPIRFRSFADLLKSSDFQDEANLDIEFESVEAAQDLIWDNWDLGFAALSSTIHNFRDPKVETPEARDCWKRLLISGHRAYRATRNYLDSYPNTDRVYIFNGRFAIARGIFRACQDAEVDAHLYERGSRNSRYTTFLNHLPHDRKPFQQRLENAWNGAPLESRESVASEFYSSRRLGVADAWKSFTKDQTPGLLPHNWNPQKRNIVIFNSSEDEFIAIGKEWKNPIYPSQSDAIEEIAESIGPRDEIQLWLRVHPNLANVNNEEMNRINALDPRLINVIPATDKISTYDLIDAAEKVLTFGSSVGIEAAFWGTPSILAGLCFYRELGSTYNSNSREETIRLLLERLPPNKTLGALKYGFYLRTYGVEFRHYVPSGLSRGSFREFDLPTPTSPVVEITPLLGRFFRRYPNTFRRLVLLLRRYVHGPYLKLFNRRMI